jgi:hypothetical protein
MYHGKFLRIINTEKKGFLTGRKPFPVDCNLLTLLALLIGDGAGSLAGGLAGGLALAAAAVGSALLQGSAGQSLDVLQGNHSSHCLVAAIIAQLPGNCNRFSRGILRFSDRIRKPLN